MVDDQRDLMQRIAGAAVHIDPGLSDRDVERLVAAARRRRLHRERLRRAVLAAGVTASLALTGTFFAVLHRGRPVPAVQVAAAPERAAEPSVPGVVRLSDGSTAVPLDADTQIELLEQRPERVALSLMRGRAQFRVTPQPKREFLVHAGDVRVTVVGTVFTVERVADRVGVTVQRGTVRVDWDAGSGLVHAGQSGWYPPLVTMPPPRPRRSKPARLAAAHVEKRDPAAELLMAADLARLAGHAEQGAELLQKLLREHPDDPTAPVAAFTLGRLLLMELKRPAEAATAFAQARRLAPNGPFAEDALAREVEALSQAGRAADARARAEDYRHLYPNGRRMATVRAAGGIK